MKLLLSILLFPLTALAQFNFTDIALVQNTLLSDEVMTYKQNVVANGGTVSDTTLKYLDEFVRGCKVDGDWTTLQFVAPFCGNDVTAARVLLKYPTGTSAIMTNGGFAANDYTETGSNGGLKGDASSYLDSGFNPVTQSSSITSFHIGTYVKGVETNGASRVISAIGNGVDKHTFLGWVNAGSQEAGVIGNTFADQYSPTPPSSGREGLLLITTSGDRVQRFYDDGSEVATGVTGTGPAAFVDLSFYVLAQNNSGSAAALSSRYIRWLSYGSGISAAAASRIYSRVLRLQTLLGRNV